MDDETFEMMCAWYGKDADTVQEYLNERDEPVFNPYSGFADDSYNDEYVGDIYE